MKATELIGKMATRTAPVETYRKAFVGKPVRILTASDRVISGLTGDKPFILGPEWCDDNWIPWIGPKRGPKSSIIIRTIKEISKGGDLGYRVVGIEALDRDHLPEEYRAKVPFCAKFSGNNKSLYLYTNNPLYATESITVGQWCSKDKFLKLLETIKQCGQHLHEINQRARAEREAWKGEETFRI